VSKEENKDYQLVPVDDINNEQGWDIRILTGPFTETVVRFGNVAVDGKADMMTFNFFIIESPDPDLDPDTNVDLQEEVGDILLSVIERSIEEESIVIKDKGTPIDN